MERGDVFEDAKKIAKAPRISIFSQPLRVRTSDLVDFGNQPYFEYVR